MKVNMYKQASAVAMLGVAVIASGCSGGGQTSLPTAAKTGGSSASSAKVKLTVKIPARTGTTASAKRSPKYVSAFTTELSIRAGTSGAGVAAAAWQIFNVGPSSPATPTVSCSTDAASGVRTCVITVTAPADAGTVDEFQVTASDSTTVATDTQPTGNFLSTGDTTLTVTVGAANAVNLSLTPVIGTLAAAKPGYSVWAAPGQTAIVVAGIIANDIDGGQIFGQPAAFANPLTFADGLTSSPFTYPSANPPASYGPPPPETVGPVQASITYLAPTLGTAGTSVTVSVSTVEPGYLPVPTVPPSTKFTLAPLVVSTNGAPIGALSAVVGAEVLLSVNEAGATSFTVSDNADAQKVLTLLSGVGGTTILSGSTIPVAANGYATFAISAVGVTSAATAPTISLTDAAGTVATIPVVITAAASPALAPAGRSVHR